MDVSTAAEQLFFVTVNLQGTTDEGSSTGTGFLYQVETVSGDRAHFLVTNKHVLEGGAGEMKARLVQRTPDGRPKYGSPATIDIEGVMEASTHHPDPNVDVAVSPRSGDQRLDRAGDSAVRPTLASGVRAHAREGRGA